MWGSPLICAPWEARQVTNFNHFTLYNMANLTLKTEINPFDVVPVDISRHQV